MIHIFAVSSLLAYLVSAYAYLAVVCVKRQRLARLAGIFLRAGFALQTIWIACLLPAGKEVALLTRSDYFFWSSWLVPLAYFIMRRRLDFPIVGTFVATAALLFMASSSYLVHFENLQAGGSEAASLIIFHALPALVAELSLVFAFIVSCVFLIQSRRIKKRKSLAEEALKGPSLESLERLNHGFVMSGFIAMTVAVLSGSLWALVENRRLLGDDLYQWLAVAAWLLLAVILHSRVSLRWSAQKLSRVTVLGAGAFILSFFLMIFLKSGVLHGGFY